MDDEQKPRTIGGQTLAAFLRGLLPEGKHWDQQIRDIEDDARAGMFWPPQMSAVDENVAETH